MSKIVVGTAGHIDHGKTSLVKLLTGVNTDNLIQEKERGLTIDLGFAYLNDEIAIIDVPGHERFIRNMVAGAFNIHVGLIVIAADDGVMPQTREHLDILMALGVSKGIVALTKIDLINDREWLDLVKTDIKDLLDLIGFETISIRKINNLNGDGIKTLKNDILDISKNHNIKFNTNNFRLFVDRVFSKIGFGTVVTGTVQSGKLTIGSEVEIMPINLKTKVRGLHSHNGKVNSISVGQRAALNLSNINVKDIKRGCVLASVDSLKTTKKIVCHISLLKFTKWEIKSNQRLRFHLGTSEVFGRIILSSYSRLKKGMSDNVIVEFEQIISVAMNDKIVIRSYSPTHTIASGIVLDINPTGRNIKIKNLIKDIPLSLKDRFSYFVEVNWNNPKSIDSWALFFFLDHEKIEYWVELNNFKKTDIGLIYSKLNFKKTCEKIILFFHNQYQLNPYRSTINIDTITCTLKIDSSWLKFVLENMTENNLLKQEKGGYSSKEYSFIPTKKDNIELNKLKKTIFKSGYKPLLKKEILIILKIMPKHLSDLLYILENQKDIISIGNNFFISSFHFNDILKKIKLYFSKEKNMSIANFKNLTSLSRKRAIPLLEFFDRNSYTIRVNDKRIKGSTLNG